jgi:hypothetical protein
MATFKDYLREEGITPSDEILELDFPTRANLPGKVQNPGAEGWLQGQPEAWLQAHALPTLYEIPDQFKGKIKLPHVLLDLYPRVDALSTQGQGHSIARQKPATRGKLNADLVSFVRLGSHLSGSAGLQAAAQLEQPAPGTPEADRLLHWRDRIGTRCSSRRRNWRDRLQRHPQAGRHPASLLTDYTDRFYKALKTGYEGQFYDMVHIDEDHGSMLKLYQFEIDNTDDGLEYQKKLEVLKKLVADGKIGEASKWNAPHMVAISFDRHLYYPLLALEDKDAVPLKLRPLAFDAPSEWEFVRDLEAFYNSAAGKEAIGPRSLYLLRNADREAKGLGFALAGNFYPDFLLWLVDDATRQAVADLRRPQGAAQSGSVAPQAGAVQRSEDLEATLNAQAKPGSSSWCSTRSSCPPPNFQTCSMLAIQRRKRTWRIGMCCSWKREGTVT